MLEISGRDLGWRGGPCCGSHLLASVPVTVSPLSSATMTYSLPSGHDHGRNDRPPAFRPQILVVAEAQGKPDVKPDRLLDDFGRDRYPLVAYFLHSLGYLTASDAASPNCRDCAGHLDGLTPAVIDLVSLH